MAIPVRWSVYGVLAILVGALVLIGLRAGPGEQRTGTVDRPHAATESGVEAGRAGTLTADPNAPASVASAGAERLDNALPEATGSLPVGVLPPQALSFAIARTGAEVELTGKLPEPARGALLADIRLSLKDARITDRTEAAGRGALSPEARAAGRFALAQVAELNRGKVELNLGRLSLSGEARDRQAMKTVTAALQQPPAGLKTQAPALTAASVSPFVFSARREAGALVLAGHLPSEDIREEIARAVRERFFHERVIDETRIADGAPPRFVEGARFALDQLSQLASGEATITGDRLRIAGQTLYPEAAARMREIIAKASLAGLKGSAEITLREEE